MMPVGAAMSDWRTDWIEEAKLAREYCANKTALAETGHRSFFAIAAADEYIKRLTAERDALAAALEETLRELSTVQTSAALAGLPAITYAGFGAKGRKCMREGGADHLAMHDADKDRRIEELEQKVSLALACEHAQKLDNEDADQRIAALEDLILEWDAGSIQSMIDRNATRAKMYAEADRIRAKRGDDGTK